MGNADVVNRANHKAISREYPKDRKIATTFENVTDG